MCIRDRYRVVIYLVVYLDPLALRVGDDQAVFHRVKYKVGGHVQPPLDSRVLDLTAASDRVGVCHHGHIGPVGKF